MRTQLLCTFSNPKMVETDLQIIRQQYEIVYNYIYILENENNDEELYITFNIDLNFNSKGKLGNTILVHRKKHTNTLYTINALNELIKLENDGILDQTYSINWENYENSIILTNSDSSLKKIDTKIYDIIKFNRN